MRSPGRYRAALAKYSQRRSRTDLARAARDQAGRDHLVHRWRTVAVDAPEKQMSGGSAHRDRILRHYGDAWLDQIGIGNFVKSNERHLAMEVEAPQRPVRARGKQVLGGEDGRRRGVPPEQVECCSLTSFVAADVHANQTLVDSNALGLQLITVSLQPKGGGGDALEVADVTDATVSVGRQMADAAPNALEVVGHDRVGVEEGRRPVEEHHRRARASLIQKVTVVVGGRHDEQPGDAPGRQGRDQLALANLIFFDTAAKNQHSTLQGELLDRMV